MSIDLNNTRNWLEQRNDLSQDTRRLILNALQSYDFSCVQYWIDSIKNNIRLLLEKIEKIEIDSSIDQLASCIQKDYESNELKPRYILVIYNQEQHDTDHLFQLNAEDINILTDDLDMRLKLAQNLVCVIVDNQHTYNIGSNDIVVTQGPVYDKLKQFIVKN